ncbi:hypothetical protein [Nocardioides endophyticus]|uniref:hypothetical protein n=1 Tax=Nocardioides endophyticus TaxID=1353775 RepID=UPI0031E5348E
MTNNDSVGSELRGWAARQMIAEDAHWAMDVILSGQRVPRLSPFVPLLLGHHFVRIAYEGAHALRSANPHLGVPELARLLTDKYASVTAQARHVSKLLDDTKKTYETVIAEFDAIAQEHHDRFTGNAVRWVRRFETDLGLYVAGGTLLGATWPAAYRLGLSVNAEGTISGQDLQAVTEEWGGTLAVLGAATLDTTPPIATLDLTRVPRIDGRDKRSDRYLSDRFDPSFPDGLKVLLLAMEGEMNTLLTFASRTTPGHELAVFRARVVALYHTLSALVRVSDRYASVTTGGMTALRDVLATAPAQGLLSRPGQMVRNRCMHYEIRDARVAIDPTVGMFGIIESVFPGKSLSDLSEDVTSVTALVAELLRQWRP